MIVLNAAMQKAGTLWVHGMTNELLVASGYRDFEDVRQRYRLTWFMRPSGHVPPLKWYKLLHLLVPHIAGETFAVSTHAPPTKGVQWAIRRGVIKAIYIYRDPRDVARSLFEHGAYLRDQAIESSTGFQHIKSIEDGIRLAQSFLPIWSQWKRTPGTLLLRYEDLRRDPERELGRMAMHLDLNLDPQVIHQIADRYDARHQREGSFASMHFNKGVVGRWRDVMSAEQQTLARAIFGSVLAEMGYEE